MKLTQELIRKLLDYDPETGFLTWRERTSDMFSSEGRCKIWNSRYAGKRTGYLGKRGYLELAIHNKLYGAHRLIWLHAFGDLGGLHIDHINGIPTDNRLPNLRLVTPAENGKNQAGRAINKSGVNGVCWNSRQGSWKAQITVDHKNISLGNFERIEDAAAARKAAEKKYGFHENHGRRS